MSQNARLRSDEELAGRVRLQVVVRVIIAATLLAVTLFVHLSGRGLPNGYNVAPLYGLVAVFFAIALIGGIGIRFDLPLPSLIRLALAQAIFDIAATTALVYVTGGADSPFSFLYILMILNASAVSRRRGVLIAAACSALAFAGLIELTFYDVIAPFSAELGGVVTGEEALVRILFGTFGFLLTGLLASYLGEQLQKTRQELEAQTVDLEKLRAINELVFDNIQSGLLTVNEKQRVMSLNPSAQKILGLGLGDVYEQPLSSLFPAAAEQLVGVNRRSPRFEELYRRTDGRQLVLGLSSSPLRDETGEPIGEVIAFQDLTELREMEDRLKRDERLAAIGRLAAGIAHEIRNPLASISGSVEILEAELELDGEDRRLMDIVLRETDRLDGLIAEFLTFVRPEGLRRISVDLKALTKDTVDSVREGLENVTVDVSVAETGNWRAAGDPEKLKQVLYNLVLNAADAMPDGGTIDVRVGLPDDGMIALEVSDSGTGIRDDERNRIFDPFFTTKEKGTGLGLAIVHKIVDAHRGYIEVESREREGTTFRVLLPVWQETLERDAALE